MKKLIIDDIEIELTKKNIKNINLSVHPPNGKVKVSAPKRVDDETIRKFIISKIPWINVQRDKFINQEKQEAKKYITGESHYFLGRKYFLNVIYTNKEKQRVNIRDKNYIDLYVRENANSDMREKIMREWYRGELKELIPSLIEKWEPIMGVKVNEFGVKSMKTLWGSCNIYAKRIWLNLELIKKSPICLEYVVVHEMIHLLERSHNKVFVAYMDQFMPNWKEIKAELNGLMYES